MERLINGRTLVEVQAEFLKPFDDSLVKRNPAGYPYIEIAEFRERLDFVVNVLNYDFVITNVSWVTVGDKKHVSCVGTLTIRDDYGQVVVTKSATGDADVIIRNEDGKAVKLGNDAKTASQDAFKSCCRMLGIGDKQLRDLRKKSKPVVENPTGSEQINANEKLYEVKVMEAFRSLGQKGFKAPAVITETGEAVELVLWKDGMEKIEECMPLSHFLKHSVGKRVRVFGVRTTFRPKKGEPVEQLILNRPFNVAREGGYHEQ